MYRLTLIFTAILFIFGCQKNEVNITPEVDNYDQAIDFREGAPAVSVVDNTLMFHNIDHYNQVREWVQNSSVQTLMSWQQSIGFSSVRYFYEEALSQYCCPDEEGNIAEIAAAYDGKIIYDPEEMDIQPLLPYVTTGWLVNLDGDFRVGSSLIRYTPDHVISVVNGDPATLATAADNPVDDPDNGVYVHPTLVEDRDGCCPWVLDAPSVSTGNSRGSKRIKTAQFYNRDESFIAGTPSTGVFYNILFTYGIKFHHQRKTWLGWTVCQRTKWDYTAKEVARLVNIPANCQCIPPGFVNPQTINKSVITGNECKYDFEDNLFPIALVVPPNAYNSIDLCVEEISLTTKALDSNLTTSNRCE